MTNKREKGKTKIIRSERGEDYIERRNDNQLGEREETIMNVMTNKWLIQRQDYSFPRNLSRSRDCTLSVTNQGIAFTTMYQPQDSN